MISVIFPIVLSPVIYFIKFSGVSRPGGGNIMKIGREELRELRKELDKLTAFISSMESGELPYFYHCFDAMKNNIEIFFYMECEDIEDFLPVLERDWKASHMMFIGVQSYDIRNTHPDADPVMCLYFARLLAEVGKYFERGSMEAVK